MLNFEIALNLNISVASVTKQYSSILVEGRRHSSAGKVTAGPAESNGSLPRGDDFRSHLWDQLRAQRSVTSMGELYLLPCRQCARWQITFIIELMNLLSGKSDSCEKDPLGTTSGLWWNQLVRYTIIQDMDPCVGFWRLSLRRLQCSHLVATHTVSAFGGKVLRWGRAQMPPNPGLAPICNTKHCLTNTKHWHIHT